MKKLIKNIIPCLLLATLMSACKQDAQETSSTLATKKADSVAKTVATGSTYMQQCLNGSGLYFGVYKLNNNIWGAGTDGAGSECIWYDSSVGTWGVNATHTSGSAQNIKGYPSLIRGWVWYTGTGSVFASSTDTDIPVQLSHLASCTSSWDVTVPTNGEKYDTAYDIWLDPSNNPNYRAQYEVMVWINYQGPAYNGSDFAPVGTKILSNVVVANNTWNIWKGNNGSNNVFTFRRATNTSTVTNLDIKALLAYAQTQGFLQSTYYLLSIQAGWEIIAGGTFTTNSYSTSIVKN